MSTGGQTYRDVIINLKVQADSNNARTFEATAEQAERIQRTSAQSVVQSFTDQREAAAGAYGVMLEHASEYENSIVQLSGNVAEFRSELGRTATGAVRVARGFVELGIASEDNMKKAVQLLARFQGTVDIVRGSAQTVQGIVRAYDAWKRAIEAVTAAQAALAAVESSRSLVSGSARGGVARAAGDVAGGVAGGAVGGAIGAGGSGLAGTALTMLGPIGVGVGLFAAGVTAAAAIFPDFREGLFELTGWTDKAAEAQKQFVDFSQNQLHSARDQIANYKTQAGFRGELYSAKTGSAAMLDQLNPLGSPVFRQMDVARARLMRLNRELADHDANFPDAGSSGVRAAIQQQRANVVREIQDLMARDLQYQQQISDERLKTTEVTLNTLKRERDKALGLADSMQAKQDEAVRRYALASPTERASLRRIVGDLREGREVKPEEAQFARGFGFVESTELSEESLLNSGIQAGAGQFIQEGSRRIEDERERAEQLSIQVAAQSELKIEISEDQDAYGRQIIEAINELQDKRLRAIEESIGARVSQLEIFARHQKIQSQHRRGIGG